MHINNGKIYSFLHRLFLSSIRNNEYKQVQFNLYPWLLKLDSNAEVLDVGCGDGTYLNLFNSNKLYGCDLEQSNFANMPQHSNFLHSDFLELNSSCNFDIISFFGVLEFYKDKSLLLEHARKLLKPNGYLIIMSPFTTNDHFLYSFFSMLFNNKSVFPIDKNDLPKDCNIIHESNIYPHNSLLLINF